MSSSNQKPISFLVRMKFAEEDRAEVEKMAAPLAEASRKEEGCITYVPHWVEGDSCVLVIYEQYKDGTALEFHRNTEHFHKYAASGLYQKMRERHVEDLTAIA